MRWIKVAIGAVIAISVIPLLVLSVINIKKSFETEKITITIELNYLVGINSYVFEHNILSDELSDYFEKGFVITNLYDHTHDINITITNWNFPYSDRLDYLVFFDNNSVQYKIFGGSMVISKTYDSIYEVNAGDIDFLDITFSKSSNVNPVVILLLSFVPIIFVGGVVLYIYKLSKKD